MNWKAVHSRNRKQSARKAKREQWKAALKKRIEEAGGVIKVDELRAASFRMEPPAPGHNHHRGVWTFRGRDWVPGYSDGERWQALCPFVPWRQDADPRVGIPMTPGAAKYFEEEIGRRFASES